MKNKFENISYLIIILTITVSINSCFRDNGIPKANLKFVELKKNNLKNNTINIYNIKFLSDLEISNSVFKNRSLPHLTCLLTNKKDFGITDIDNAEIRLVGYFESKDVYKNIDTLKKNKTLNKTKEFQYEVKVVFYNNIKSNNKYSSKSDIDKNLLNAPCVTCKLEKRFYLNTSKPYLSHPMCIPVEDILKALND